MFSAWSGASNAYAAVNFQNAPPGGIIDSWLYTPVFDARSGATASFYLRSADAFWADQVSFGFVNSDGSFTSASLTMVNPVPDGGWTQYMASVDADVLGSTRFAFRYTGTYYSANYVGLDSLTITALDAPVPEPASIALLAGGLFGLVAMRRRPRARPNC